MHKNRRTSTKSAVRRSVATLLACASVSVNAKPAASQETISEAPKTIPAERAEIPVADAVPVASNGPPTELSLLPPVNSTLEMRIAKRPWLLEKLTGQKTEPSVKMTPPRPPLEVHPPENDPPSLGRPVLSGSDLGWRLRKDAGVAVGDPPTKQPDESAKSIKTGTPANIPNTSGQTSPEKKTEVSTRREQEEVPEQELPLKSQAAPKQGSKPASEQESQPAAEQESNRSFEPLKIRELRIDLDGRPVGEEIESDSAKKGQPDQAESPRAESPKVRAPVAVDELKSAPGSARKPIDLAIEQERSVTGRVGDITPEPLELAADLDYTGFPRESIELNRTVRGMQSMMRACLRYYYARPEDANKRSNWGVMHSIMVYGPDTKIRTERRNYNAIAWIAGNNACRGQLLLAEEEGMIVARSGVGLQGHQAQLLATLSLCDVPFEYSLYAGDQRFTVGDLIESEMLACRRDEELTFTLIGLAHYLDTDIVWRNLEGEIWDFERLIREELKQPIVGSACGGTHRLMGYAHALRKRRAEGKPITGQWKRAEIYTQDFERYAYRLQNRDGSMTTDWFEGREDNGDLDRKIQTTGHIVEWLLTLTPDSKLQDRRLVSAVRFLMKSMYENRGHDWKIGPKGHALRSLAMYYERVYRSGPAWRTPNVARSSQSRR